MRLLNEGNSSTYTGTTSAVTVTLGYKPICVIIYNETDGDVMWIHMNGMAAAKALQFLNHDTAQLSILATNGITLTNTGFTAGTSLSESAKVFRYIAF